MVGVITGNGPGLLGDSRQILNSVLNSGGALNAQRDPVSARILGTLGQLGVSTQGASGDNVFVNAANGGLVIQNTDEMLFGTGPEDVIARTYNSVGDTVGSNLRADDWITSLQRQVTNLTGTVNTSSSTVTHIDGDGSQVVYTYATSGPNTGSYVAKDGAGGYDTLTFSGTTWTWTNANTRVQELYDSGNGGRITDVIDPSGNDMKFTYGANGLVSQVTTATSAHTETTSLTYSGSNLTQVVTSYWDGASRTTKTLTRVRYGYDTSNRLSTVTVDLSPTDNSISDGKAYVTTYGYDGTSNRVNSITQSDGSALSIQWVLIGSAYKVASYTQTVSSNQSHTISFDYNTAGQTTVTDPAGQTTVTDPAGQATVLKYDAEGELTEIDAPAANTTATAQVFQFTYSSRQYHREQHRWADPEPAAGRRLAERPQLQGGRSEQAGDGRSAAHLGVAARSDRIRPWKPVGWRGVGFGAGNLGYGVWGSGYEGRAKHGFSIGIAKRKCWRSSQRDR